MRDLIELIKVYAYWLAVDVALKKIGSVISWFASRFKRVYPVNVSSFNAVSVRSSAALPLVTKVTRIGRSVKWLKYGKIGVIIGLLALTTIFDYLPDNINSVDDLSDDEKLKAFKGMKMKVDKAKLLNDIREMQSLSEMDVPPTIPNRLSYLAIKEDAQISLKFLEEVFNDKQLFIDAKNGDHQNVIPTAPASNATDYTDVDPKDSFMKIMVLNNFHNIVGPIPGMPLMPYKPQVDLIEELEDANLLQPASYQKHVQKLMTATTLEEFTKSYLMIYSLVHQQVVAKVKEFNSMMSTLQQDKALISESTNQNLLLTGTGINV